MRRGLFALVALFLVLGSTAWFAQAADEKPIAQLATYADDTDVVRGGRALELTPQLPLFSRDVVQTRKGEAVLAFTDGTRMRLKSRTRIEVSEDTNRRSVDVMFGRLWSYIARRQGMTTGFKTGGTIAAVRGTKIEYAANEDGSVDIGVIEGSLIITFTNADGSTSTIELKAGESLHFPPKGPPGPPKPFKAGDIVGGESANLDPGQQKDINTRLVKVTATGGNDPFNPENPTGEPGGALGSPTPTPRATPTATATPTPGETPVATPTRTPGSTPRPSRTTNPTPVRTIEPNPTATPTPTATATPTVVVTPHPPRPSNTPRPSVNPSGTPFPTGTQGGPQRLGLADFRGTYEGTFRIRADKGGLEDTLGLTRGPAVLESRMNGRMLTLSGAPPFVTVSGMLDGDSVILRGSGTVLGTTGVKAEFIGRFVSTARGARLSGVYALGLGGNLPGGQMVTYNFDGQQ